MDDLIKQIVSQTGISDDVAKQVVEIVSGFLKDKLPGPVGEQITAALSGGEIPELPGMSGGIAGMLGGLFGRGGK